MDESEDSNVYLNEGGILPWERPLPPGHISMLHMYEGSTNVVGYAGLDTIDELVGPFLVQVRAAKYLADIARINQWGGSSGELKREVLFSGGILIFKNGLIPGTEIEGSDLVQDGDIWVARSATDLYAADGSLRKLIFEGLDGEDRVKRIESIINGYKTQKEKREEAENKSRYEDYQRGRRSVRGSCF